MGNFSDKFESILDHLGQIGQDVIDMSKDALEAVKKEVRDLKDKVAEEIDESNEG